jgi:hypothetical protein
MQYSATRGVYIIFLLDDKYCELLTYICDRIKIVSPLGRVHLLVYKEANKMYIQWGGSVSS